MAPPKKLPWFRFHVEALADVKLRRMKPEHRWLWVAILGTARTSAIPGWLMISVREACTAEDLADIAALPVRTVNAGLALMERAEMISMDPDLGAWRVTNWEKRQFASDTSTERVKKHRSEVVSETSMERSITVPVTPPEDRRQKTEEPTPSEQAQPLALVSPQEPSAAPTSGYPDDFEAWWASYPRKVGKQAACAAWRKARRKAGSAQKLHDAMTAHIAGWRATGTAEQYIPHPATWLNEGRYDDPAPRATTTRSDLGPQETYR